MLPWKFVTVTDARPSPTSPTYLRPSPNDWKRLFQNGPSSIFLVGVAATNETPSPRDTKRRYLAGSELITAAAFQVTIKENTPIVFEARPARR